MEGMKDAFLRMVRAARKIDKLGDAYLKADVDNGNVLMDAYGDIADAIYCIVGEHTEDFESSVTYTALTAPILTDERRALILLAEYNKHHPEQPVVDMPKPNLISPESMRKMMERNGGYMTPEGDWS